MGRTVIHGAVVVVLAALVAAFGSAIGITTVWPVLLAVAVGLAVWPLSLGRVGAYALGAVVGWVAMALRAGFLPDIVVSRTLAVVIGVVVLTLVAALTSDLVPLWAGLAGYAAFAGLYEPLYAESPTLFLSESPVALVTVLLAGGLGLAAAGLAEMVTGGAPAREVAVERPVAPRSEEVVS
jgi:hypothetical protein